MTVASFAVMGFDPVGIFVIGALEVAGAVALLVPRLAGLAGLAFVGLMVGAVTATLLTFGVAMVLVPAAYLALATAIAWGRRSGVAELVATVRGR